MVAMLVFDNSIVSGNSDFFDLLFSLDLSFGFIGMQFVVNVASSERLCFWTESQIPGAAR